MVTVEAGKADIALVGSVEALVIIAVEAGKADIALMGSVEPLVVIVVGDVDE